MPVKTGIQSSLKSGVPGSRYSDHDPGLAGMTATLFNEFLIRRSALALALAPALGACMPSGTNLFRSRFTGTAKRFAFAQSDSLPGLSSELFLRGFIGNVINEQTSQEEQSWQNQ
jgi:hypothetical protein